MRLVLALALTLVVPGPAAAAVIVTESRPYVVYERGSNVGGPALLDGRPVWGETDGDNRAHIAGNLEVRLIGLASGVNRPVGPRGVTAAAVAGKLVAARTPEAVVVLDRETGAERHRRDARRLPRTVTRVRVR